ncbi:MAG: non-ribosomal peptide synthase/amino acid adenylation enzyme, partial [Burkholderiales bacterium]|nr:non-ribosomal peptide synthase/amino acid adenylation enzyme [Burkholderiales bacterium]
MLTSKNAIIFGETALATRCIEYLLTNNWNIKAVFTHDIYVINWCKERSIPCLNTRQAFEFNNLNSCYLFSIINPYIIPNELLAKLKPIKAINYHDSLLPKYAGVNSTTWAILNNEPFHGISWHEIIAGIDEGDIYYTTEIPVEEADTAFSLNLKCTEAAFSGFRKLISDIEQDQLIGIKQDLSQKTYFGRAHIPDNYAYISPVDTISYINTLFKSLNFSDGYINPVATVKVKIKGQEKFSVLDPSACVLKDIYGKSVNHNFVFADIDLYHLSPAELSGCKKLKQKEFDYYNKLTELLNKYETTSSLLSYVLPSDEKQEIDLSNKMSADIVCLFLSIILSRLNGSDTFLKIYHNHIDNTNYLINEIIEHISIIPIKEKNLDFSYCEMTQKINDEFINNKLDLFKDFGYRYNLNLCSEFAITDNYSGTIDNHSVVFTIKQNKVSVKFYKKDAVFIKMLIKTINVLFAGHLDDIRTNPQVKYLQLLSKEDYQMVVYDWNKTDRDYPQDKTIHQLFEEQAAKTPDNIAVVYEDKQVTYRELNQSANQLAHYLREKYQIKGDDLIALCLNRSEYMIITILGVLKSGAGYVPIDPEYPDERINYIIKDTRAKALIINSHNQEPTDKVIPGSFQEAPHSHISNNPYPNILRVDDKKFIRILKKYPITNPELNITSKNLAYVIYTSGATGKPKGVVQQHNNVHRLLTATNDFYQFNIHDVWTLFHSYVFDFSVWELWGAICYGGKLIIPTIEQIKDTSLFYKLCNKQKVTVLNQTPKVFYEFINVALENEKLDDLRYVIFGGDALNLLSLKSWFNKYVDYQPKLVNMYGITETTVHVTYKEIHEQDTDKVLNIGKAIPDQKIYVLDKSLKPLPIGSIGELYISGAGLARGYLNLQELTKERFLPNPFQANTEKQSSINTRIYKTGDLVRYLSNGDLEYIGRNDSQVKIRGYRIELNEIEAQLIGCPGIKQAVVLALESPTNENSLIGNKFLVAYYVSDTIL